MRRPRVNNWVRSKRGHKGGDGGAIANSRKIGCLWGVAHGCALTTETEVKTNECAAETTRDNDGETREGYLTPRAGDENDSGWSEFGKYVKAKHTEEAKNGGKF